MPNGGGHFVLLTLGSTSDTYKFTHGDKIVKRRREVEIQQFNALNIKNASELQPVH